MIFAYGEYQKNIKFLAYYRIAKFVFLRKNEFAAYNIAHAAITKFMTISEKYVKTYMFIQYLCNNIKDSNDILNINRDTNELHKHVIDFKIIEDCMLLYSEQINISVTDACNAFREAKCVIINAEREHTNEKVIDEKYYDIVESIEETAKNAIILFESLIELIKMRICLMDDVKEKTKYISQYLKH